jgi:glycosyltransferase involved in cell wall biosynthesis
VNVARATMQNSDQSQLRDPLRVLMGMPERGSLGGPPASEPPFVSELRRLGVYVAEETYVYGEQLTTGTTVFARMRRVLRSAARLRRRMLDEKFDVIHLNSSFDARALLRDVATLRRLPSNRGKIFIKFHGSDADLLRATNPAQRRFVNSMLGRVDGIGVLSSEERENFLRAGVNENRIFVVKNVIGIEPYESKTSLRERLGLSNDLPLLLFIARFIHAKGLLDVIQACAILRDRGLKFRLLCVGDGPARVEAEAESARLQLAEYVRFFGYVAESETRSFYQESTMLVFPTYHYEGFPMVIFKSVAAGLPIITTRIRAARDYLKEPENCLWVEPRRPEQLAQRIAALLDQSELRTAMSQNNRALANKFTAAAIAPEYLDVYNQLIS